ncbi:mitochondrial carrier domain-containing protein [Entophlyctis helioformis]|nr:mitochondrial carrier domain-containing protein [Entophlyctis helioformis]
MPSFYADRAAEAAAALKKPADWAEFQQLSGSLYSAAPPASPDGRFAEHSLDSLLHDASASSAFLTQLLMYCVAKHTAVSMTVPFENAIILKQVQFVPSDEYLDRMLQSSSAQRFDNGLNGGPKQSDPDAAFEDATDDDRDDDRSFVDVDEYASDLEKRAFRSSRRQPTTTANMAADSSGYLLRTTFDDDDPTRPPYQLPVLDVGTFGVIYRIATLNDEGFASLWKGNYAYFFKDLLFSWTQPTVSDVLATVLSIPIDDAPLTHAESPNSAVGLLLASHVISGVLYSPLDLVQTRLVVQTSKRMRRKYRSVWHAIGTILTEEYPNDPSGIFFAPNLLVPSVAYYLLSPVFKHMGPFFIDRWIGVSQEDQPLEYLFFELGFSLLELVVMLPIETVRRRLMCQVIRRTPQRQSNRSKRGALEEREFQTLVETSPIPYAGVFDCIYRVVAEEGGPRGVDGNAGGSLPGQGLLSSLGRLSGLYRGFTARLVANVLVACLQAVIKTIDVADSD